MMRRDQKVQLELIQAEIHSSNRTDAFNLVRNTWDRSGRRLLPVNGGQVFGIAAE
jgi:hypothetical protein